MRANATRVDRAALRVPYRADIRVVRQAIQKAVAVAHGGGVGRALAARRVDEPARAARAIDEHPAAAAPILADAAVAVGVDVAKQAGRATAADATTVHVALGASDAAVRAARAHAVRADRPLAIAVDGATLPFHAAAAGGVVATAVEVALAAVPHSICAGGGATEPGLARAGGAVCVISARAPGRARPTAVAATVHVALVLISDAVVTTRRRAACIFAADGREAVDAPLARGSDAAARAAPTATVHGSLAAVQGTVRTGDRDADARFERAGEPGRTVPVVLAPRTLLTASRAIAATVHAGLAGATDPVVTARRADAGVGALVRRGQ